MNYHQEGRYTMTYNHIVVCNDMDKAQWYIAKEIEQNESHVRIITKRCNATGVYMDNALVHLLSYDDWVISRLNVSAFKSGYRGVLSRLVYAEPEIRGLIAKSLGMRLWLKTMVERCERGTASGV